jgi:hypothetical protein
LVAIYSRYFSCILAADSDTTCRDYIARFHHPWIGIVTFIGIALAWRLWWTCVFGLLNAMAILGGFIGCGIAVLRF